MKKWKLWELTSKPPKWIHFLLDLLMFSGVIDFFSWKVHKTCGLPQLLFLATKIHRFNHWGCGDEWRNDVILLVAILANSYQKWTRRMVLVWGKNQQTPWHNNWYNCKVAKYYQRGTGVSFLLQAAVFFHDSYLTGRLQRQQGNVKGKQMAALSSWALMGSFFVLTLQRRKAVQTSWVLCYNYTWWSIEYMFVSLKAFFSEVKWCQRCFIQKLKLQLHGRFPSICFFGAPTMSRNLSQLWEALVVQSKRKVVYVMWMVAQSLGIAP